MSEIIAAKQLPVCKIAYSKDLQKIEFCITALKGCESLSALGRSWLAFYVALAKCGYDQIRAPMAAIAHAQWLAFGYTKSQASAYRAHRELEDAGFIKRHSHRVGHDCRRAIIDIVHDRFIYWSKRATKKVRPLPTKSDNNLHLSNCEAYDCTNKSGMLQTTNSRTPIFNKHKSKKHTRKSENKTKYDSWRDPRLHTIDLVLKRDNVPNRKSLFNLAKAIIAGDIDNNILDLSNLPPGRWLSMLHSEREYIAAKEFIPALKGVKKMTGPDNKASHLISNVVASLEPPKKITYELIKSPPRPEPAPPVQSLDKDELAVLRAACARVDAQKERLRNDADREQAELEKIASRQASTIPREPKSA